MTSELETVMKVRKLRREDRKLSLADRVDTKPPKLPVPLERDVQRGVLLTLQHHPRVKWCARMNTGAFVVGQRFIRAGFKGCADIIGQLEGGQFLAVEVKRPGEKPTPVQQAFLDSVNEGGGVAFCARASEDVWRHLGPPVRAA